MRFIIELLRKLFKKTPRNNLHQGGGGSPCDESVQNANNDELYPIEADEPPLSECSPEVKTFRIPSVKVFNPPHLRREVVLSSHSETTSPKHSDDGNCRTSSSVSSESFELVAEAKKDFLPNEEDSKRAAELGQKGERISNYAALPITTYGKQLRNLYIPSKPGSYTEIDTLIISVSGLYVLETKNYRGWIYGDEDWKMWTVTYSRQKKYTFYNPIKQNATHIWALQKLLPDIRADCYFSFVVFSDSSEFKKMDYYSPRTYIMKHGELNGFFRAFQKENEGLLSREAVNQLFQKLKPYCDVSESVKQQHIADVNRKRFASNDRYS